MEKEYTLKDIKETFGLSRAMILYYEDNGVIHPSRRENGYRFYSHDDIQNIKRCIFLHNIGYKLVDAIDIVKNNTELTEQDFIQRENEIQRQINISNGLIKQMDHQRSYSQLTPLKFEKVVPPSYYVYYSNCEEGYTDILQSKESNLMIQKLGLTDFIINYDLNEEGALVKDKHARACPTFVATEFFDEEGLGKLELVRYKSAIRVKVKSAQVEINQEDSKKVMEYLHTHKLKLVGKIFSEAFIFSLDSNSTILYLPIE